MNKRYEKYEDLFEQIKNVFNQALIENHLTSKINYEKKNNVEFVSKCENVIKEFPEFQKLTYLIKSIILDSSSFDEYCIIILPLLGPASILTFEPKKLLKESSISL